MAGTGTAHLRPTDDALLRAQDVVVHYRTATGGRKVHALDGVSVDILDGETLGLVGESGCGKSTLARAIIQLPRPTSGSVRFAGRELTTLNRRALRAIRDEMQMVFQDPISSLNPRRKVFDIVEDPLRIWKRGGGREREARVAELLDQVGLNIEQAAERRPHEFSGGQCQRIAIARALILGPKVVICDEPVSALDVSVQAQILNLLKDLKALYGLTLLFIAHDLAVVKHMSDRIAVMYLGKLCEVADSQTLYRQPAHPYTAALLEAIPVPEPTVARTRPRAARGEPASPVDPPSGCRFHTRCPRAELVCKSAEPVMREVSEGQFAACHFPLVGAPSSSTG
jgi:peptide/nickel transport system ATP-binding protein